MGEQDELREHLARLITAFHILHYKDVLDCYGHVSIRNPLNHNTFFSSSNPANLITAPGDLQMWNVGDGSPVKTPQGGTLSTMTSRVSPHSEHHIHASLYAAYPSINSVVHGHSPQLVAFASPGVPPLRACYHMAAFLGASVPVFDISTRYPSTGGPVSYLGSMLGSATGSSGSIVEKDHPHNMLINTKGLGDALASAFALPASASGAALEMAKSLTLSSTASGDKKHQLPDHALLLLRGHGFATWGTSLPDAVYRAVFAVENAKIQMMAMQAQTNVRGSTNGLKGEKMEIDMGKGWDGGLKGDEMRDAARTINGGEAKAWGSWLREVRVCGRYENELDGKYKS